MSKHYEKPRSFDEFIRLVFDHETTEPAWYWKESWDDPEPAVAVTYLRDLYSSPAGVLAGYSDAQIEQGVVFQLFTGVSNFHWNLAFSEVEISSRVSAILSIKTFFNEIYAPRCEPVSTFAPGERANPLNSSCYMWWDTSPLLNSKDHEVILACVDVMRYCLRIPNLACQESAIHGLGHLHSNDERGLLVESAIDEFLCSGLPNVSKLRQYALSARKGMVQ